MFKKFLIAFAGFAVVVLVLGAVKVAQIRELSSVVQVTPPSAVTSTEAREVVWKPRIDAIGTLAPVEGVTLAADADGRVVRIDVENGARVKQGDLILEQDTSVEEEQLKSAQAREQLAQLQYDRSRELVARNTISQSELDTDVAALAQAKADVGALQATIERKRIRAPFDGRVGIRQVNLGEYVSRGQAVVPLQKLDPMYVNFSVPQRQIPDLDLGQAVLVTVDAFGAPFTGTVTAINSVVDPSTRNISLQATVPNPGEKLRPGMFAQVQVELPSGEPQVVLPSTAIAYAPYGNSVFVIEKMKDASGKEYLGVRQQIVKLGDTRGDLIAITEGVKPGEVVATSGVFKLRNGAPVQVNNEVQPSAEVAPQPSNS